MRKWVFAAGVLLLVPWVGTVAWVWAGSDAGERNGAEQEIHEERNSDAEQETTLDQVQVDQSSHISESRQRWIILDGRDKNEYRRLEDYLPGVVACQMPDQIDGGEYDPEVWKCQAVIARTYICHLMADRETIHEEELDLDYPGEKQELLAEGKERAVKKLEMAEKAVSATGGVVMKYEGLYILPMFHEISAGQTRTGTADFPYLQSVSSVQDVNRAEYRMTETFSPDNFAAKITRITDAAPVSAADLPSAIQTIRRDAAGYMEQVQVGASTYTGDEIRYSLGLPSPHFTIEAADDAIRVTVQGRGHGYGLSQAGADTLARDGWTYEDILQYYYKNIAIERE